MMPEEPTYDELRQRIGETLAQKILDIRPDAPIILCTGYSEKIGGGRAWEIGIRK